MSSDHPNTNATDNETRTEQALRGSELSYRRLFEAAKDGILILDADTGHISDVNPFLVKLLGFSHGEMVGKTVGEISPFKDIWSNQIMLERLQKNGYVRYHNLPLETRDGRKIAVEFVSNVYQAGDKKVIQCNIRDITERKRVEEAFRESEQRFRALFEGSHEGVFQSTLGGQFCLANPALARMLGYASSQELIAGVTDIGRQLNVDPGRGPNSSGGSQSEAKCRISSSKPVAKMASRSGYQKTPMPSATQAAPCSTTKACSKTSPGGSGRRTSCAGSTAPCA